MKNKNFINQSLGAGSSPNQTGETFTRENRHGVLSYFYRTFVLLFMLLTLGVGQMWAGQYNMNWQGKVYFRVPDNWDLSTYSHVQIALTRTTSTTESNYVDYIGEMSRIGTTRLYYISVNCNHNGWNQNEYVLFTANSSNKSATTNTIQSINQYYTTPLDYGFNNISNCYLCNPTSEDNGASVSANWNSSRDDLAKLAQTVTLYTNGSESYAGGTVTINGTYFTGDNTVSTSSTSNSSSTSAAYSNVVGATVTLTATESDGYSFVGWYDSSSGDLISADKEHSYICKAAKEIDAKWIPYYCNTALSATSGTTGAGTDISLTCSIVDSKYRITVKGTGLTSISAGVYYKYGGVGDGHQLIADATLVTNSSTNITYDIPANAKTPVFYTNLFVMRASESAYDQIKDKTIDWSYSCGVTNYSVTYNGSSASGSVPTDNSVYTSGDEVTVLGANTLSMDNYSFSGWNTSSDMSGTDRAVSSTFNISANTTLYAKWTQTITLHANTEHHGTGTNSSATAVWNKASLEGFSATSGASGYTLDGYYTTAVGGTKVLNADGSFADTNVSGYITSGKWSHTGSAPTLYAHWVADTWDLYSDETKLGTFANTSDDHYRLNLNITNDNQAQWHFRQNNSTYYYTGTDNPLNMNVTLVSGSGMIAWQGGSTGHYTLEVFKSSSTWYLRAYASPQINFTASPSNGSVSASSNWEDAVAAGSYVMYGSDVTFTATPASHYTLEGWYSASDFSGDNLGTTNPLTVSNVTSNTARYAKFALEQYTITLDIDESHHGTIDGKTTSQVVDYRGATTTVPYLPTGADGYKFMGFYTETGGGGTKLINADGTWIASVDGYTDGSKNWIHDADATLYAYYQAATITSLALPGGSLYTVGGSAFTATATVSAFDGNALVCWAVLNSSEEEVSTTFTPASGNSVTVSIPATPGSYKVVATLKEGTGCEGTVLDTEERSFTVEGSYTVTITNGTGDSSVGEETTATATADAAAAGMKFDHWNVTGTITEYTSGSATTSSITFRASSNIELTAVYAEDYSTGWYLATDAFDAGSWVAEKTEFLKRTGETAGSIAYVSYDLNRAGSYPTNNQFQFKIQDSNTSRTYGDNGAGTMTYGNCTDWSLVDASEKDVTKVNVNVTGTYTFKLDYANMKISVIYPVVNQLQVYTTTGTDEATVVQDYDWTLTAGIYSQDVTLQAAKTYTFKVVDNSVHYGRSTTLSATNKSATLTTDGGNISLTTTVAGTYKISYNPATHEVSVSLNGETLTSVSVDYGWDLHTNVSVGSFTYPTITATVPDGLNFGGWTYTGTVTFGNASATSTTITSATTGATVNANFNSEKVIYFDNSAARWDDSNGIWVYLFNDTYGVWYNDDVDGGVHPQVNRVEYGRMTRIGDSYIYYYKYSTNSTIAGVAFTKADQHNYTAFNKTSAAWLTNFNTCQPCYIASYTYVTKNAVGYHSTGYWKKYGTTNSGCSMWIYYDSEWHEHQFTNDDPSSFVYKTSATLSSAGTGYSYNVSRCAGSCLRRKDYSGSITSIDSDYPRELIDKGENGTLTTSSAGTYNFTLDLSGDHIYLYTEYPLSVGDYRVVLNNGTKNHEAGRIFRARDVAQTDTVSFFVDHTKANSLHVDTCTNASTSTPTWGTILDVPASQLNLSKAPYNTKTSVYNFEITRTRHKDVSLNEITGDDQVYNGKFYIRTDAADGHWITYRTTPDNKMLYSAKSLTTEAQFDYYFTKWVETGKNLKFTIANDYSSCISDTLYGDTYTGGADESHQTLLANANVRYMWNSQNNTISRAYLDGATVVGSEFLVMHSEDSKLFQSTATSDAHGDPITDLVFTDTKNWIYQADVKALPNAEVTLTAKYNGTYQNFISDGHEQTLFGGDEEDLVTIYPLRIVYDFKTNILISAWLAEEDQSLGANILALDADMMIVRKLQDPAAQITFTTGSLTDVKTIYGALRFDYDDMVGHLNTWDGNYGKLMYDISFPFDVNVKDVFGVGNMDDHWIIEKYNGARRASEGWFLESDPFWETLTEDSVMHAYEGYTVIIDRPSFNNSESVIWKNKGEGSSVYLYFPSANANSKTISSGPTSISVPAHTCKKDQRFLSSDGETYLNHQITDSHWNMIGTPLFENQNAASVTPIDDGKELKYYYEWNSVDNSYLVSSALEVGGITPFKAMHGYMVQFAGTINFTGSHISSIVAASSAPSRLDNTAKYQIELQLENSDNKTSRTYIELSENACDTFELNEDVYMMRSSKTADLYTYAGNYDVAANVLSIGSHTIPVGISVKQADTYTFRMPKEFNGTVTLVDTYNQTRTDLTLNEYEVFLQQGNCKGRFYIEINLDGVATSIENINGQNTINDGKAHKFLKNGIMYILRDGTVYDIHGAKVE